MPAGFKLQEAVTVPDALVTVFNTVTRDLEIPLPWPRPQNYVPEQAEDPILIWGGSSSVGIFMLQVFRYYRFRNLIAVASKTHHEHLLSLGAKATFDYRAGNIIDQILAETRTKPKAASPAIPFIVDCIGSKSGSLQPLSHIAQSGARVAVMLPVIVKDASEHTAPEYAMDAQTEAAWKEGVTVRGVRTHFYLDVLLPYSCLPLSTRLTSIRMNF